jgi:hypothetical protein
MSFQIDFSDLDKIKDLARERKRLMNQNAETAVANTVLLGIARIANDCPVVTGRARGSIAGSLADEAGIDLQGDPREVAAGTAESMTEIRGLEGRIGSNVEYILYLEYGHRATGPKKLTDRQRRFLFAVGILKVVNGQVAKGRVVPASVHARINRRAGITGRVKGKGMFRKNIPVIRNHFQYMMNRAAEATAAGSLLREG